MKEAKIVVLDGYTLNPGDISWAEFEKLGSLIVYDRTEASQIAERIGDAEIVLTNKTQLSSKTLAECPTVRYIGVLATGYNVVDVATAKERGILVTNIPAYGTAAVAQMVFALLLEICHHVSEHSLSVHKGDWTIDKDWCFWNYPLIELSGKTMGIIGFGRIGLAVSQIAVALGMKVLAYDLSPNRSLETERCRFASLEETLSSSDVISLHCPLLPSNQGMINKDSISLMKDGVILINTARGPLIAEQDLADALQSGKVYAAGLDVVSAEPIQLGNPLLNAKNCFITPHIAWAPKESRARLMRIASENLRAFLSGNPVNVVS
ncbi:MAG: D-2-hydroxyacid dehydrogenase [Clostridiales bacterium]|nr:D-2-hydroxyacid dehydrogenase [Clostridiales bacterium]